MSDSQVTITLPMSEHAFGTALFILAALFLSALIFGLLPRKGQPSDPMDQLQRKMGLTGLPPVLVLFLAVIWVALFIALLIGIFWVLFGIVDRAAAASTEEVYDLRWSLLSLTAITAALGAVISLPFTLIRVALNRRQTETAEQGHITDRINKAVEGLGAEKTVSRIWRTVSYELNGEPHTDYEGRDKKFTPPDGATNVQRGSWDIANRTKPNLEVRIGAIYALERIAQDSDRDHVQIMEILCAYIRQNAPAPQEDDWPELEMKEGEDDGPLEADWDERMQAFHEAQEERKKTLKLREDIQVALTVIGRRSEKQRRLEAGCGVEAPFPFDVPCPEFDGPEDGHDQAALDAYRKDFDDWRETLRAYTGYRLDLRGADLRGADLSSLVLNGAQFAGTYLHGAILMNAQLQGAFLMDARLPGATLMDARLQGANLIRARLQRARLVQARLQGANLMRAGLQGGAHLGEARLQGAHLRTVRLQGADLREVRLQGAELWAARFDPDTKLAAANLQGAAARSVDFTNVPQIADHLEGMFGDASVTLPGGHGPEHRFWPSHWPKIEFDDDVFEGEWRKWLANPTTYTPPD